MEEMSDKWKGATRLMLIGLLAVLWSIQWCYVCCGASSGAGAEACRHGGDVRQLELSAAGKYLSAVLQYEFAGSSDAEHHLRC
jgi:hypothetical protein